MRSGTTVCARLGNNSSPRQAAFDGGRSPSAQGAEEVRMITSRQYRRMLTVAFLIGLAMAPVINAVLP